MCTVAVGADGCFHRAAAYCAPMHTILVGKERLRAHAVRFHQEFLSVAASASGRDMRVIHGRIGMTASKDVMGVAMTILTIGS